MNLELESFSSYQSDLLSKLHSTNLHQETEESFLSLLKNEKQNKPYFIKVGSDTYRVVSNAKTQKIQDENKKKLQSSNKNKNNQYNNHSQKFKIKQHDRDAILNQDYAIQQNVWLQLRPIDQEKFLNKLSDKLQSLIQETVKILKEIQLNDIKKYIFKFEKINLKINLRLIKNKLIITIYTRNKKLIRNICNTTVQKKLYHRLQSCFLDLDIEIYYDIENFDSDTSSDSNSSSQDDQKHKSTEKDRNEDNDEI